MTTIARGNTGRLTILFAPITGDVDVDDVTCTVTSPSNVSSLLTVVEDGTNRFHADVAVGDSEELGEWTVRWDSNPPSELITVSDAYTVIEFPITVTSRALVSNIIERIRRQLESTVRHETNRLALAVDETETTFTLTNDLVATIRAGTILSVGRELVRVISANSGSHEVVVYRRWLDSMVEAHAAGAEILINPRFTRWDIHEAIIAEIDSWAPELFRVDSYQSTVADTDQSFELPASMSDAIGVVALHRRWDEESDSTAWPSLNFRLSRGAVGTWTGASTSGLRIRMLPQSGTLRNGTVHALIALPFDVHSNPPGEDSDLVDDYGIEWSMLELVELGAKMRILGDAETGRSARTAQDEPRRAEETPVGAALQLAQTTRQNYVRRRGDEVRKLRAKYKVRSW